MTAAPATQAAPPAGPARRAEAGAAPVTRPARNPARLSGTARRAMYPAMDQQSLTVNGEPRPFAPDATVASLLAEIGLDLRKVAVERNLEIVPRSAYAETVLAAGDRLEIVHFIGGG